MAHSPTSTKTLAGKAAQKIAFPVPQTGLWAKPRQARIEDDPQVSLGLGVVLAALNGASWQVVESDLRTPMSAALAEHVREVLGAPGPGALRRPFNQIVQEISWFIWYGDQPAEIIWSAPDASGLRLPVDLIALDPDRVKRYTDPETGEYGPVVIAGAEAPIPGKKIIHFRRPMGALRDAVKGPYERKAHIEGIRQVALEFRGTTPPTIVKNPEKIQELNLSDGEVQDMTRELADAIVRTQAGDHSVLVTLKDVLELNWQNQSGFNAESFIKSEEREDTNIHAALGTLFLRMGINGEGNRSLGEVHMQLVSRQAQNHAKAIADALNGPWRPGGGLVGALCELNFGVTDPREYPRLEPTGLEPRAVLEALGNLPSLQSSGWITPDLRDENVLRAGLGLPPREEEGADE